LILKKEDLVEISVHAKVYATDGKAAVEALPYVVLKKYPWE
jgi:hypothetical protein